MKKIVYTIALLLATQVLQAQFLKKLKSKVNDVVNTTTSSANAPAAQAPSATKFTDPAKYGSVVKTYNKKEIEAAMGGESGGGFTLYFESFKVVNNQFTAQIADNWTVYNYQGAQLQNTGQKPKMAAHLFEMFNGSEKDMLSKDFSSIDNYKAMVNQGRHIQSGRQPGKVDQEFSFNGKAFGRFMSAFVAHNPDSSVVAANGMCYNKGVSYVLASSTGQTVTFPGPAMMPPIVSPNGKWSASLTTTAAGTTAYRIDGAKIPMAGFGSGGPWIHNSGNIFYVAAGSNKVLMKNNEVAHTFDMPIDMKQLFIGADDKNMCWQGDHGLFFSDGTAFENADFPVKVNINGKDVMYFMAVNVTSGTLYLCHHDL